MSQRSRLRNHLGDLVARQYPGAKLLSVQRLGADQGPKDCPTEKDVGFGQPLHLSLVEQNGKRRELVLHTASSDCYGHDRRSDRAAEMLLAFDTFANIPGQAAALDVGAITSSGALCSLRNASEFYLLTDWVPGTLYASDLRRIAEKRILTEADRQRCRALADYLVRLHGERGGQPPQYIRSVRDLIGSGEGIFGIIDGYPNQVPAAPPARLQAMEEACAEWRWRLRGRERRLARIHGDFHPFNILFDDETAISLLDASRGCLGDPADDVTALTVNYLFFGVTHPKARHALGELWHTFWERYLGSSEDSELLEVAPPYLAWRILVVCNPIWYPHVSADARETLLRHAERALARGRMKLAPPWEDEW